MHFVTVRTYDKRTTFDNGKKVTVVPTGKLYLNIDSICYVNLEADEYGLYTICMNHLLFHVNKEECQLILDEIQKYNGRTTVKALRKE